MIHFIVLYKSSKERHCEERSNPFVFTFLDCFVPRNDALALICANI